MIALLPDLVNHLWQSTLVAALAAVLTLAVRRNAARVRYWLWFAASMKFLLPFAALSGLGAVLARHFAAAIATPLLLKPALQLSAPARLLPVTQQTGWLLPLVTALWLLGVVVVVAMRLVQDARLRRVLAGASSLAVAAGLPVKTAPHLLEPSLVGLLHPVVLLPAGLLPHLSAPQTDAILAHELAHARRRDNLTAAIHMTVEALFWFYPLVWWIGARMIAAREQACDERVIQAGHDPQTYAAAILKVCRFCVQSPLACVSGASGSDLKQRVARIMTATPARDLDFARMLLLSGALLATLALPVAAGFLTNPFTAVAVQVTAVTQQLARIVPAPLVELVSPAVSEPPPLPRLRPMKAVAAAMPSLPAATAPVPQPSLLALDTPADVQAIAATANPISAGAVRSQDVLLALRPAGSGDPDAVTCRVPQILPGSRLAGPQICKTNRVWATLRQNGEAITADGVSVVTANGSLIGWRNNSRPCTVTAFATFGAEPPPTYCF